MHSYEKINFHFSSSFVHSLTKLRANWWNRGFRSGCFRNHSNSLPHYSWSHLSCWIPIQCRPFLRRECRFKKRDYTGFGIRTDRRRRGRNLYLFNWNRGVMKQYETYKNIRKRAVIFGLPISLFAVMMISIIASLLIIIFSFSFGIIIGVIILNVGLFIALMKITNNPQLFHFSKPFPQIISNKKPTLFNYEED